MKFLLIKSKFSHKRMKISLSYEIAELKRFFKNILEFRGKNLFFSYEHTKNRL
jgi:hypothetical protein